MSVRWGWRAVSSSSQSEISFARVTVAMVFLLFCVVVFEGFPPSPVFGFTSRIDTRSHSCHNDLLSTNDCLGDATTTGGILDQGPYPCQGGYAKLSVCLRNRVPGLAVSLRCNE